MSRIDRLHAMCAMLKSQRAVTRAAFLTRFEISLASFKRDLEYIRDRIGMPVVYDRELGAYRIDAQDPTGRKEIPDLWLDDEEAMALITLHHLLGSLDAAGLIAPHIEPIRKRLEHVLADLGTNGSELLRRVRFIPTGTRRHSPEHFKAVGNALFERRQLELRFFTKNTNTISDRVISPQRLVHYRGNWYLDAWCHKRERLQTFALDGIQAIRVLDTAAREVDPVDLDALVESSYGIFSGQADKTARLLFSAERARWVALESWHPDQRGSWQTDGAWLLEVPYADDRELVLDILRHGAAVEVLDPPELRARVIEQLRAALDQYPGPASNDRLDHDRHHTNGNPHASA